jgi:hypothetical protein
MTTSLISKDTLTYKKKIVFNAGAEATIDYFQNKRNFAPEIQLLFSPFGLPFVPIEVLGTNANKIISSLNWTKDRNNPGGMLSLEIVPDADIIKKIVSIINKFSFNLYSKIWGELGVDLEDLFKPMTLCQLWINGYHVMTGNVRSCKRNSSVANDAKSVSYSVMIDELGNLYNMNSISLDLIEQDGMQTQIIDAIQKSLELSATIKGLPISEGIKSILSAFKLSNLSAGISLSDGIPLSLRLISESNPRGAVANLSIASSMTVDASMYQQHSSGGGQQSVWGFIKNLIPSPWMELYTESGGRTIVTDTLGAPAVMFPGLSYVVSRTTPYSNVLLGTVNPAWITKLLPFELNALSMLIGGDFIIITDDMIEEKSLGFDSINQNTVFHTNFAAGGTTNAADLADKAIKCPGPLNPFASGGIPTFGLREMFQTIDATNLMGLGTAGSYSERIGKNFGLPGVITSKAALSNLLAVWFRNQSRFREGSVTCKCIPYARPGMYCLYLPTRSRGYTENLRDIGIYYIDSISHAYSISNTDVTNQTTLNLIRGVPLPATVAQTAMLLFDLEILPPESGLLDGEYELLSSVRKVRGGFPL